MLKRDAPNRMEMFQIWLNLPRASKMVDADFKMLWAEQIPTRTLNDGCEVRKRGALVEKLPRFFGARTFGRAFRCSRNTPCPKVPVSRAHLRRRVHKSESAANLGESAANAREDRETRHPKPRARRCGSWPECSRALRRTFLSGVLFEEET